MKLVFGAIMLAGLFLIMASTGSTADPPVEVGAVTWGRDLDAAKKQSTETGKPILILFQEIPG